MAEMVHRRVERAVATLTLDSPGNRNALGAALVAQLTGALEEARDDAEVRVVVLDHAGSTFCSGADLREAAAEGGPEQGPERMLALLRLVVELPKPVIGLVRGAARAGGVGLVGACDLVLAGPDATFAFSEVRLGLAPAIISLTTVPRLDDRSAARYLLTGETFGAAEAERMGLVTEAAEDPDAALSALLATLRRCSPQGLAETKPLTTARVRAAIAADADRVRAQSARLFASAEAREGMTAVLQKRPPRWAVT
jgi:enoyl-CoA hydratase